MVASGVAIIVLYRQIAVQELVEITERQNVAVTRAFANSVWPRFASFVRNVPTTNGNEIRSHKTTAELDQAVRTLMRGLPALKIKVYNLNGLTVYSSQATQIGENKADNAGYLVAQKGGVASEITWRGKFDAFEGVVSKRNVVSSYIPIIDDASGVVAVFELYTDVTPLLGRIDEVQTLIALIAAGVLGCLYFLLVSMVWTGNRTIRSQIEIISAHKDRLGQQIKKRKKAERERNEAREQLHQSQKMEAMGTLAGGVAHDFNNILGIMNGYTQLVIGDLPENSAQRQMLDEVVQVGERGADLVEQILAFTRKDNKTDTLVRLDWSLNESLKMLRATLPATIRLDCQIPNLQARVRTDEIRIHQLVTNLCINAAHAIGSAPGAIDISCQLENVSQGGAAKMSPLFDAQSADAITLEQRPDGQGGKLWFGSLSPGEYLRLSINDNGCGIEGAILDRVLEPFFTTKEVGKGTGLGLAAVAGTMRSCRGAFVIETKVGQGTRFDLYFPIVEDGAASSKIDISDLRGTERILLVEDATETRREAKATFSNLGYEITTSSDGATALQVFKMTPGEWDLVITDQALPKLAGIDLARKILELKPDMPIVMVSGAAQKTLQAEAKALGIAEFHVKPLEAIELVRVVRRVIDTTSVRAKLPPERMSGPAQLHLNN